MGRGSSYYECLMLGARPSMGGWRCGGWDFVVLGPFRGVPGRWVRGHFLSAGPLLRSRSNACRLCGGKVKKRLLVKFFLSVSKFFVISRRRFPYRRSLVESDGRKRAGQTPPLPGKVRWPQGRRGENRRKRQDI